MLNNASEREGNGGMLFKLGRELYINSYYSH